MPHTPLTIAGSDPTGGAGLEADLKVFLAHGLSGAALATALTTQDTKGVTEVVPISVSRFRRRLDTLLDDVPIAAVKLGLLPGHGLVRTIAEALTQRPPRFLVIDPVLAPTRGRPFLDRRGRHELIRRLLPIASVVTPNIDEAARLLGTSPAAVRRNPERATGTLLHSGVGAVLLKGGHGSGNRSVDYLDDGSTLTELSIPRIRGKNGEVHGTGCALSSALLANLVRGSGLEQAATDAKQWVHDAMLAAVPIGSGRLQLRFTGRV